MQVLQATTFFVHTYHLFHTSSYTHTIGFLYADPTHVRLACGWDKRANSESCGWPFAPLMGRSGLQSPNSFRRVPHHQFITTITTRNTPMNWKKKTMKHKKK